MTRTIQEHVNCFPGRIAVDEFYQESVEELTTRDNEDGVAEPDDREVPQVLEVNGMATDTEKGEP